MCAGSGLVENSSRDGAAEYQGGRVVTQFMFWRAEHGRVGVIEVARTEMPEDMEE